MSQTAITEVLPKPVGMFAVSGKSLAANRWKSSRCHGKGALSVNFSKATSKPASSIGRSSVLATDGLSGRRGRPAGWALIGIGDPSHHDHYVAGGRVVGRAAQGLDPLFALAAERNEQHLVGRQVDQV